MTTGQPILEQGRAEKAECEHTKKEKKMVEFEQKEEFEQKAVFGPYGLDLDCECECDEANEGCALEHCEGGLRCAREELTGY